MADPFFILPSDLQRTFTLTKRKYEQDFIAYYNTLITHLYLPDTSGGKKLEEDKKVVEELVKDIKHLLDPLFQHSWEEVAEIQGRMDLVAKKLQEASQQIKANLDKAEGIHKKLEEQNISEENLFNSNEVFLERVSKLSAEATKEPEPKKEPTFTERASGIADYLLEKDEDKQSIGQKFARSILSQTPYARAMEGALTSFQTVQKGKKDKQAIKDKAAAKMKMKQEAVDVELENAAGMTGEDRAKAGGAASSPTGGGAKGPDFYTDSQGRTTAADKASESIFTKMDKSAAASTMGPFGQAYQTVSGMFKGGETAGGLKVADIAKGVAEGLKDFFSNGAMSAKWTKSIYDAG